MVAHQKQEYVDYIMSSACLPKLRNRVLKLQAIEIQHWPMLRLMALGSVMLLGACHSQCSPEVAHEYGVKAFADRWLGRPADLQPDHLCEADEAHFVQGWEEAQGLMCTAKLGWQHGLAGTTQQELCVEEKIQPDSYLATYRLGQQLGAMRSEMIDLSQLVMRGETLSPAQASRQRGLLFEMNEIQVLAEQMGLVEPADITAQAP